MRNIITLFTWTVLSFSLICCGDGKDASSTKELNDNAIAKEQIAKAADTVHVVDNTIHRLKVNLIGGRLKNVFCDSNNVQLSAAQTHGIDPITDLRTAYNLHSPIQRIYSCDAYTLDELTHSMPYLVPRAAALLHDIGIGFSDSIKARGGKRYKIKVTSVMRTDITVAKLRKRNRNATSDSAHRYGTTFDISYSKFICCDSSYQVAQEDLKNILAEVLYKMRKDGRCYVKYEVKQGCFHITAR